MPTKTFKDGSVVATHEDDSLSLVTSGSAMDLYRLRVLISSIEFNLKTGMWLGNANGMHAAERLSGQKFGRGDKARIAAIAWARREYNRILEEG